MDRITPGLACLMAATLIGCLPDSPGFVGDDGPVDDDDDDDSATFDGPNVREEVDLGATWDCDAVGGGPFCVEDYIALAETRVGDEFDLDACVEQTVVWVADALAGLEPLPDPIDDHATAEELADRVVGALSLAPLLDGLDERLLVATTIAEWEVPSGTEARLLFSDPLVGTFEVALLRPDVPHVPHALMGLPGHPLSESVLEDFLGEHHGRVYAEEGYLVAVPSFRGYDSGQAEHLATGSLLCAGLSMVAIRNYEALLVDKFLRYQRARGDVDRIAAVGHSEGSTTGNVLTRFHFGLDAWVYDVTTSYLNVQPCSDLPSLDCLIGETAPALYEHHWRINDPNNPVPVVPILEQEYAYPYGPDEVLAFLADVLDEGV